MHPGPAAHRSVEEPFHAIPRIRESHATASPDSQDAKFSAQKETSARGIS